MACGIEIMDIQDNVSATDSEDFAQMEAADDVAERLHATNPWLRDDNRYTFETVGSRSLRRMPSR